MTCEGCNCSQKKNKKDRFKNSRKLVWFILVCCISLMGAALYLIGADSVPILSAGIPTMLGLVGAWTGITNWRETKDEKSK